jgi:VanZ family protein
MRLLFKISFFITLGAVSILSVVRSYCSLPDFVSISDLANHTAAFLVLSILLKCSYSYFRTLLWSGLMIIYALLIEAVQYFLPYRSASFGDLVADSAGILLALMLLRLPALRYCKIIK